MILVPWSRTWTEINENLDVPGKYFRRYSLFMFGILLCLLQQFLVVIHTYTFFIKADGLIYFFPQILGSLLYFVFIFTYLAMVKNSN